MTGNISPKFEISPQFHYGIDTPNLCRQIVTMLNSLLFYQHNLNDQVIDKTIGTELGAIYTRLQKVIFMVEQAKKNQENERIRAAIVQSILKKELSNKVIHTQGAAEMQAVKVEKTLQNTKQNEPKLMSNTIHEYPKQLQKHQVIMKPQSYSLTQINYDSNFQSPVNTILESIVKKEDKSLINTMQEDHEEIYKNIPQHQKPSEKKQNLKPQTASEKQINYDFNPQIPVRTAQPEKFFGHRVDSIQEDNSALDLSSMRNYQQNLSSPENSSLDLSFSPPDKKLRMSAKSHQQSEISSSGKYSLASNFATPTMSISNHLQGHGPNGRGITRNKPKTIRNRLFCGECTGCLRNNDCGICRYCKDKTKFGGQNRLRQKCLHRRCQLDTYHRKSTQNNVKMSNEGQMSSGGQMYDKKIFNSPPSNEGKMFNGQLSNKYISNGHIENNNSFKSNLSAITIHSPNSDAGVDTTAKSDIKNETHKEALNPDKAKDILETGQAIFLEAQQSRMTDPMMHSLKVQQSSGNLVSNTGNENKNDQKSGTLQVQTCAQSRTNKWRAKHEAMLNSANNNKKKAEF